MEKYRIIIDTNLWISLLFGKRVSELHKLCNSDLIDVYICKELQEEFIRIASKEKIRKYTTDERIVQTFLRDVNDLFLLAFSETVEANFILTGDKDLLSLKFHGNTKIVTYNEFVEITRIFTNGKQTTH
ncbi:MAG: hypothetical protein FWH18_05175 [Marinilabiliaceae bacterium]|nr:hypothetical protein [Marinilabiliaceae bacterium]